VGADSPTEGGAVLRTDESAPGRRAGGPVRNPDANTVKMPHRALAHYPGFERSLYLTDRRSDQPMATGGMVTDQSTPMHPATAHTLTRLLRQQGYRW